MSTTGSTTASDTTANPAIAAVEDSAGRPQRADARRNRERILEAARAALEQHGPDASLDEIARGAGVGIGTLYRHFPDRETLLEAVFHDRVEMLRECGEELLTADEPGGALVTWLHQQLEHASTYQSLAASVMITQLDEVLCGEASPCAGLRTVGEQLLANAQSAGAIRSDVDVDDLIRLVNAIALVTDEQGVDAANRLFTLMVDGMRAPQG